MRFTRPTNLIFPWVLTTVRRGRPVWWRVLLTLAVLAHSQAGARAGLPADTSPEIRRIAAADPVVETTLELLLIPSPSGEEQRIREWIQKRLRALGITGEVDPQGNLVASLPASPGYEGAPGVLLNAHLDMVWLSEAARNGSIALRLRSDFGDGKEWLASAGATTLGADDKAGVAAILDVLARLRGQHPQQPRPLPHGPLAVAFTVEEETTGTGGRQLDTTRFPARYVLVVDGFQVFEITNELAGTTEVTIRIQGVRGGHSGEKIHLPDNINAIKVMSEIDRLVPQGVVKWGKRRKVITSINAGVAKGGSAPNAIAETAELTYLVRSTDVADQAALLTRIRSVVRRTEQKYQKVQPGVRIALDVHDGLPPWSASPNSRLLQIAQKTAAELAGRRVTPQSSHAASDVNLFGTGRTNAAGQPLEPLLIGVANIEEAHTAKERLDWQSLLAGRNWLLALIRALSEERP